MGGVGLNTTCPYCGVGCGVRMESNVVHGDTGHPANFGKLCVKGSTLGQTLDDSRRLMHPMVGGAEVEWDFALDHIAARFLDAIEKHGRDAVAFYGSGQFLTEDYYVANKLMKGFIGSGNMDTNSRLCMSSTVAGYVRAFGEDVVPCVYEDIDEADLLVFVGANAAWCHPILFERAQAARAMRGTKIVVIDPRKTATAALADLHLPIRPDEDVGLFNLLFTAFNDRNCLDVAYIARHTQNYAAALSAAQSNVASAETLGLRPEILDEFLELFCTTERTVTLFSQGVNQSVSGTDKVNAITNVHLATGRIGRPGMGPFSLTGQPNAMGGREVGGLSNLLAAHLRFDDSNDRDLLQEFWRAPHLPKQPGYKAVEMFEAVARGKIKAIWIAATNPAESLPRSLHIRAALEACPFVVVSDCWPTETTRLANVVLPAASWGEKDGTVTNSERTISRQRPFRDGVGQARPDWWMFAELGKRMGFTAQFSYTGPADIFREHAGLSGYKNNGERLFNIGALAGLSQEEYDAMPPTQWPLGHKRLFAEGGFSTPDKRGKFVAVTTADSKQRDASFPFTLNTGRLRDQWHTMTRTGSVPALMESAGEANFAISPVDAEKLNIGQGDLIRVTTRHASAILPAAITPAQREREIFAAMHWTDAHSGAGNVNRLIGPERDPISGQPGGKHEPAAIELLPAMWHGVLQGYSSEVPKGTFHAARVPLQGAMHRLTLAGWKTLPAPDALSDWAARVCGADADDERVEFLDAGRSAYRLGVIRGGQLQSCLFIAREKALLPEHEALAAVFAESINAADRAAILRRGKVAAGPKRGRKICVCYNVAEPTIIDLIRTLNLTSVAAIGGACKAGTNCGSCKGELAQILAQTKEMAA